MTVMWKFKALTFLCGLQSKNPCQLSNKESAMPVNAGAPNAQEVNFELGTRKCFELPPFNHVKWVTTTMFAFISGNSGCHI